MSSPNLNNATIVGCILSYISAILYAFDGNHVTDQLCKVGRYLYHRVLIHIVVLTFVLEEVDRIGKS